MRISTGAGGLATLGLIGAAIGVGISSGGAGLIAIPLVFIFVFLIGCSVSLFLVWASRVRFNIAKELFTDRILCLTMSKW